MLPASRPVTDPDAAAFFDVDNTMMIGASIFHFAKGMASRDFFSWRDLLAFTARQTRLRVGGEHTSDLHSTRESALAFVTGKDVGEIVALGEEIYDEEMSDRIWRGTEALARMHLDAGQRVWLVTATPVELARIIANRLELTGALGTVAESVDGVYTGRIVGDVLHGEAKAAAVRSLAARAGLDLTRCSAYSDSINDLPMLSLVGRAVAVNPDSALRAEAKRRNWEIRDFRTGHKAARIGVPAALGLGATAGGVVAAIAASRAHRRGQFSPAFGAVRSATQHARRRRRRRAASAPRSRATSRAPAQRRAAG